MQKYFKLSAEKMRAICGIAESRIFPVVAIENNTVGGKGFDAFVSLDSGDGWFKGAYVGKLEMFAARGEFVSESDYLAQDAAVVVEEVETIVAQPVAATWQKSRDEMGYVHTLQTGHEGYFVKVQKSHAGDYFVTAQHVDDIAGGDVEYKKDLRAAKRFAETLVETSQWMDYTFDPMVTRATLAQPVADEWTPEEDADAWKGRDAALIAAAKDRGAALSLVERIAPRVSLAKPDAPECVCILADVPQESNADVMARAVAFVRDIRLTREYLAAHDGEPATLDAGVSDNEHVRALAQRETEIQAAFASQQHTIPTQNGMRAYAQGKRASFDNPYAFPSPSWYGWEQGFILARGRAAAEQERALDAEQARADAARKLFGMPGVYAPVFPPMSPDVDTENGDDGEEDARADGLSCDVCDCELAPGQIGKCDACQEDDDDNPSGFINHYKCHRCAFEWSDEWSCMVDDDCPECGARHVSPHTSEDA